MPPTAKKATPAAPTGADKPSTSTSTKGAAKAAKKAAAPKRTSVKTQDGVEIGWVEG